MAGNNIANASDLRSLTQLQYDKLLSLLSSAIHTHRKNIKILEVKRGNGFTIYIVKRQGAYYPYLVEVSDLGIVRVLGVLI